MVKNTAKLADTHSLDESTKEGITQTGTRNILFTLLGIQVEHKLCVSCNKCLLIRNV